MFNITHDFGDEVFSNFKFSFQHISVQFDDDVQRCTICVLESGDATLCKGVAVCSPVDIFNKNTGRKVALTKTLKIASSLYPNLFTREFRKEVWDAYFKARGNRYE